VREAQRQSYPANLAPRASQVMARSTLLEMWASRTGTPIGAMLPSRKAPGQCRTRSGIRHWTGLIALVTRPAAGHRCLRFGPFVAIGRPSRICGRSVQRAPLRRPTPGNSTRCISWRRQSSSSHRRGRPRACSSTSGRLGRIAARIQRLHSRALGRALNGFQSRPIAQCGTACGLGHAETWYWAPAQDGFSGALTTCRVALEGRCGE
jgi:hypothetical protein